MSRPAKLVLPLAVLAALAAAGYQWGPALRARLAAGRQDAEAAGPAEVRSHQVARGQLRIGLLEDGQLRAIKNHSVGSQLSNRAKISWVVAEGKQVRKGEKLIEFEKKDLEEAIKQKETDLDAARRALVVAEESLKIELSSGKSAVSAAESHLDEARKALKKYRELEAPKRFKDLESGSSTARQKVAEAETACTETRRKADEDLFVEEEQRQNLEKQMASSGDAVKAAQTALASAVLQQKMFRAYEYPEGLQAKQQAVTNADLELAKTRVSAESSKLQKEDELKRAKERIKRLEKELETHHKEIAKCLVTAPVDGMVLYGDPGQGGRRWYYSGGDGEDGKIKVGGVWWQGSTMLTIPDLSAFEIDIAISEEYRGKVRPDCRALVTIEAIPGLKLEGRLKSISSLAQARVEWDEASPKVFKGIVEIKGSDPRMISGMSARVEIVAEIVENALLVPIEAVFADGPEQVCFLPRGKRFEKRRVKVGRSNDDFVEILGGLAEREEVGLSRPPQTLVLAGSSPLAEAPPAAPQAKGPPEAKAPPPPKPEAKPEAEPETPEATPEPAESAQDPGDALPAEVETEE
jgi:HlyD family secretion protein